MHHESVLKFYFLRLYSTARKTFVSSLAGATLIRTHPEDLEGNPPAPNRWRTPYVTNLCLISTLARDDGRLCRHVHRRNHLSHPVIINPPVIAQIVKLVRTIQSTVLNEMRSVIAGIQNIFTYVALQNSYNYIRHINISEIYFRTLIKILFRVSQKYMERFWKELMTIFSGRWYGYIYIYIYIIL